MIQYTKGYSGIFPCSVQTFAQHFNNWKTNMLKAIPISAETVGLAFQAQLAVQYAQKSKRKRRTEFNRLKRTLIAMRLVPTTFDIQYIGWSIDHNGEHHILVVGHIHDKSV